MELPDPYGRQGAALFSAAIIYTRTFLTNVKSVSKFDDNTVAFRQAVMIYVVHDLNPRAMSPKVKGFVQVQRWFQD